MTAALLFVLFAAAAAAPLQEFSFENATPLVTVEGRGAQVYTCTAEGWSAPAPDAILYDASGKPAGRHTVGPTWIWNDNSAINGTVVKKTPAPNSAADVPWLLLSARSDPGQSGFLSQVKWVRRSNTHGGVTPTTGCDTAHLDQKTRIPYTATYTFYQ